MIKLQKMLPFLLIYFFMFFSIIKADEYSTAYKLASIEAGYNLPKDHRLVKRFSYLLKSLDKKYQEDEKQIADMTSTCIDLLEKNGVEEKMENIMEGLNTLYIPKSKTIGYKKCISAYVLLRSKGYSHKSSLNNVIIYLKQINAY